MKRKLTLSIRDELLEEAKKAATGGTSGIIKEYLPNSPQTQTPYY